MYRMKQLKSNMKINISIVYHPVNSKIEYEKKHTVGYPGFFDRDELFYKRITNNKKTRFESL